MLSTFRGQLQTDGYSGYESFYSKEERKALSGQVELAACWAHARRKFYDAREEHPLAKTILAQIQKLYRIEETLREENAPAETRCAARQEQSLPILAAIHDELINVQNQFLPKSLMNKAVSYTMTLWERLLVYTRHGQMEIDNNLIENAIRPTAVGKKNWLFFGSSDAGQTSAILYCLLGTCRMLDINPQEYLQEVLSALPTMTNQTAHLYTPANWTASRSEMPK